MLKKKRFQPELITSSKSKANSSIKAEIINMPTRFKDKQRSIIEKQFASLESCMKKAKIYMEENNKWEDRNNEKPS